MFFQRGENEIVRSIEDRIAQLTGYPVENGEGLQVLRYGVGGHYRVHCDWFDPRFPGNESLLRTGGQRVATVIMYLNTVTRGGETYFPKLDLRIKPKEGSALQWWNVDEQGNPDPTTTHSGEDVLEGCKWICTKWIRERAYQ
jgi:prolyl 4-hydroxylase